MHAIFGKFWDLWLATKVMTNSEKTGYKKRTKNMSESLTLEPSGLYANG